MKNNDKITMDNPVPAAFGQEPLKSTRPSRKPKSDADRASERSSERDGAAAAVAASIPADRDRLLGVAMECVELYNNAVIGRADFAALVISERYEASIWKLNGGSFFGACADEESAGSIVKRHCAAVPGVVPMWGQPGEFLIDVKDIQCWVKYGGGLGSVINSHFEFNAVDLDGPFISETGYRSHFCGVVCGLAVDAVAAAIFADFLGRHRRYIEAEYQDRRAEDRLPDWIQALPVPARRRRAVKEFDETGHAAPDGFALVDVVLTDRQAFIVRKWAEAARPRIKAAMREAKKSPAASPAAPSPAATVESGDDDAGQDGDADADRPEPGQCYKIVNVHHPCFLGSLGRTVVIAKVFPGGRSVFAYDDRPVTYRRNRNWRMVVDYDPRCVQTVYGMDSLERVWQYWRQKLTKKQRWRC